MSCLALVPQRFSVLVKVILIFYSPFIFRMPLIHYFKQFISIIFWLEGLNYCIFIISVYVVNKNINLRRTDALISSNIITFVWQSWNMDFFLKNLLLPFCKIQLFPTHWLVIYPILFLVSHSAVVNHFAIGASFVRILIAHLANVVHGWFVN